MRNALSKADINRFENELFLCLVKQVVVYSDGRIKFIFHNGARTEDLIEF